MRPDVEWLEGRILDVVGQVPRSAANWPGESSLPADVTIDFGAYATRGKRNRLIAHELSSFFFFFDFFFLNGGNRLLQPIKIKINK